MANAELSLLFGSFRNGLSRGPVSTWGEGGTEGTQAEQSCGEFHLEHHRSQGTKGGKKDHAPSEFSIFGLFDDFEYLQR